MKKIYFLLFLVTVITNSCFKEESEIIHQSKTGAVIATISPINTVFIISDLENSYTDFSFSVDGDFDKVEIEVTHRRLGISGIIETYTQPTTDTITYTVPELVAALDGVTSDALQAEDAFVISAVVTSPSGFSTRSTSSAYYCYVACESNLEGTYDVVSNGTNTDVAPPAVNFESVVTLTRVDGITYSLDNCFAGVYEFWYCDLYGYCFQDVGLIREFCGQLSGTWTDGWGESYPVTGGVDPATGKLTISWTNSWGDAVRSVYTPQIP